MRGGGDNKTFQKVPRCGIEIKEGILDDAIGFKCTYLSRKKIKSAFLKQSIISTLCLTWKERGFSFQMSSI